MKKIIYIIFLSVVCALTVTSCTEESIKPSTSITPSDETGSGSEDPYDER